MGRKKKGQDLQDRIDRYLKEYDLDGLNEANDMAALTQMCQLELNMEQIQGALESMKNLVEDSKKVKDLMSSLRDATQSWSTLQAELGISRKKRQTDSDESPLQYIQRIQDLSKKFLHKRLKVVNCGGCGQLLGKYFIYVNETGEDGSIDSVTNKPKDYLHTIRIQCWKCGKFGIDTNE